MVTGLDRLARSTRAIKRRDRGGEALADIVPQLFRLSMRQTRLAAYLRAADFPLPGLVAPVSVVPSAVPLPVPALGVIPDE